METIAIKRVYDSKQADGSYRILVDRLWPRGIRKVDLQFDEWNKDIAPSVALRIWFAHKKEHFAKFTKQYQQELFTKEEELNRLSDIAKTKNISLLYGAKDPKINHAIILRNVLLEKIKNNQMYNPA
jgi:uncharacterized protein YeaO (DUF488 family)